MRSLRYTMQLGVYRTTARYLRKPIRACLSTSAVGFATERLISGFVRWSVVRGFVRDIRLSSRCDWVDLDGGHGNDNTTAVNRTPRGGRSGSSALQQLQLDARTES